LIKSNYKLIKVLNNSINKVIWGLGIGDWGLGPIPNPPIPNPQILNQYITLSIK